MGVKLSEWRIKVLDGGVFDTLTRINGAAEKTAGKFGGLQSQVNGFTTGLKSAAAEVPGLNNLLSVASNPYALATAGVVALGTAAFTATNMAMGFEKGMAQINTTARLARPELDALRNQLLQMGGQSTVNLEQIPGAYNQIISAVNDAGKALDIFEPALKASQAGFTDIKTVAEAVTNTMGSVGNATPTAVFDTLFATMRVGKAEFADIANYLPKIIPLANNVGIKYQEIAGAFALMTGKGQSAEQSAMLLQNAMVALSKPAVTKAFEKSGVAIFDQAGNMRSLVDVVDDLSKKTTGLSDKQRQAFLAGLGLDTQAAGSFSVLSQYGQEFRQLVGETTNSAGEMNAAFERSLNPADRFKILTNQFKVELTQLGYKVLPYVNTALDKVNQTVVWVKDNSELVGSYFKAWAAPLRLSWSVLKGVYNLSIELGGMGNLMEGLFGGSGDIWPGVKQFLTNFYQGVDVLLKAIDDASEGKFKSAMNRFTEFNTKLAVEASTRAYNPSVADLTFGTNAGLNAWNPSGAALKSLELKIADKPKSALESLNLPAGDKPRGPGGSDGTLGVIKDSLKAVDNGGKQQRNVTVNIHGLLRDTRMTVNNTTGQTISELEDLILKTLIRAINGAEQAFS